MKLKREYTLKGEKKYWALEPENVDECAILHLLAKEYPQVFEFVSEFILGGMTETVYLKINRAKGIVIRCGKNESEKKKI